MLFTILFMFVRLVIMIAGEYSSTGKPPKKNLFLMAGPERWEGGGGREEREGGGGGKREERGGGGRRGEGGQLNYRF